MKFVKIDDEYFLNLNAFSDFFIEKNNWNGDFCIKGRRIDKDDEVLIKEFGERINAVDFLHNLLQGK